MGARATLFSVAALIAMLSPLFGGPEQRLFQTIELGGAPVTMGVAQSIWDRFDSDDCPCFGAVLPASVTIAPVAADISTGN